MKMNIKNEHGRTKVLAFGFDRCNFDCYVASRVSNEFEIIFARYDEHVDLNDYEICIIPSGIFETIERRSSLITDAVFHSYDKQRLLEFERMIMNFIKSKKILIFLISETIRKLRLNDLNTKKIEDSDLAKKYLLGFFPNSSSKFEEPHLKHNKNEFQKYTEKYGVGKTLIIPDSYSEKKVEYTRLISDGSNNYGVELLEKKLFFLPYHTTQKSFESLYSLITITIESVTNYILNNTVNIPDWVKNYQFTSEKNCNLRIIELEKQIEVESKKLEELERFKSILCNQGDSLVSEVVKILRSFFGQEVDDKDEKLDDFSILNEDGVVICSGEIKGVSGNCKRAYLSQLNANRDMKDYPDEMKGLLIINDNLKNRDIRKKFESEIPNDCLKYAMKENINIVRTIDLLNMMKIYELKSMHDRKLFFKKLILGGSGWLKCDGETIELIIPN